MDENNATQRRKKPEIPGPFTPVQINSEMSSKEAYFELLRAWVNQANMSQNALACFPYYLMANYPQLFQSQGTTSGLLNLNPTLISPVIGQNAGGNGQIRGDRRIADYFDNDLRQEEIINQNGGYEFVIAPLWKRMIAEFIDIMILLLIKLLLTFTIVDLFELNLGIDFDLATLKKSFEDDYTEFLSFSSEFLLLEIITKILVCFYEAMWTMHGHIYVGGGTPGKILMGIRIVHVEAVFPLQPVQPGFNLNNNGTQLRALLYPASNPGFRRAFLRAVAKNILMALLFPMCFVMLFFKNNRTGYDIMTKTVVVEENHAPVLRRR